MPYPQKRKHCNGISQTIHVTVVSFPEIYHKNKPQNKVKIPVPWMVFGYDSQGTSGPPKKSQVEQVEFERLISWINRLQEITFLGLWDPGQWSTFILFLGVVFFSHSKLFNSANSMSFCLVVFFCTSTSWGFVQNLPCCVCCCDS